MRPRAPSGVVVRPLNLTVRSHMKLGATFWACRHAPAMLCAAASLLTVACTDDCTRSIGSPIRSPNGEWTVQTKRSTCGGAVLALGSDSTVVELSRHKPNYRDLSVVVLSAEGLRSEDISMRWTSNYQLDMTVPSHTNIMTLMASAYDIDISLNFVPADPTDRAKWVSYTRAMIEWTDQAPTHAGPPPRPPQPQAADAGSQK